MDKEVLRELIREGHDEIRNAHLFNRPCHFERNGRYVLVGIRQAGKSCMLYQRARMLLAGGHDVSEIVYINFDDERLLGMTAAEFDEILQAHSSMYSCKPIFFFDEIQNINGWEHFARRLANQMYSVYITGSNARMLSRDIATTLGGRYIDMMVFPYSFSEYLLSTSAGAVPIDANEWLYGARRGEAMKRFGEYLRWGGFPELQLFTNKRGWLNSLYGKILLGDIVARNGIRNHHVVRLVMKRLAENIGQSVSYNRIANLIKSTGASTSVASVMEYVGYVKDACIVFTTENYASKFAERESVKKHYFTDNGLLGIFLMAENAPLLENVCATHLYRKYGGDVYYYKKNVEVDFYVPGEEMAIQVCCTVSDTSTFEREVAALRKLDAVMPLRRMLIITLDDERSVTADNGKTIEVMPAWKWLMRDF